MRDERKEGQRWGGRGSSSQRISQQGNPQSGSEFPITGRMQDVFWGDSNHQYWARLPKTLHT